jgi:putative SOS response-associated peptidase YedK
MTWSALDGPARGSMEDLIDHELHLIVTCGRCHREVRMTPTEAADLLGGDCTLIMARDRLVCSWCCAKGRSLIDVRPDSLDRSAKHEVFKAEQDVRIWSAKDPRTDPALLAAKANWEKRRPRDRLETMCNAYRLKIPLSVLEKDMADVGLPLQFEDGARPNLPAWEMTRPTNTLPVFRPIDAYEPGKGLQLMSKRWWLVPFFHRGPVKAWKAMCTNARAETVATSRTFKGPFERRRCIVPADAWYEWTWPDGRGKDKASQRWRFELQSGEWFGFAGLWDRQEHDGEVTESFTIITTDAGPDAAPYHDRQPVALERREFAQWLDLSADPKPLLAPSPVGRLSVLKADVEAGAGGEPQSSRVGP